VYIFIIFVVVVECITHPMIPFDNFRLLELGEKKFFILGSFLFLMTLKYKSSMHINQIYVIHNVFCIQWLAQSTRNHML
jgi:hypothetical protein